MRILLDPAVSATGAATGGAGGPASPSPAPAATPSPAPVTATSAAPAVLEKKEPAAPAEGSAKGSAKSPWLETAKPADPAAKAPQAEPAKEPAKADEKYSLKVPEGMSMEAAALEKYGAEKKALGLSQEQTQKLLEHDLASQKAQHEGLVKQVHEQDAKWAEEYKAKCGEKYVENAEMIKRVFDYGDSDGSFRKSLGDMGLGNAPQLLAFVEKFIPLFREPSLKAPSRAVTSEPDNRTPQERLTAKYEARFAKGGTA